MKSAGIIAEYNPFHNGHKYHIEKTREKSGAQCIVAVMSGSFVQRGEPALYSKHERASLAVQGGADLVFELPSYFSLQSAGGFAMAGVRLLSAAGVDFISFGAECDDLSLLKKTGDILSCESAHFSTLLREQLRNGASFACARAAAMENTDAQCAAVLSSPNNILACEYLSAIKKTGSNAMPVLVKRCGANHDSDNPQSNIASASHIRKLICEKENVSVFMPNTCSEKPVFLNDFEQLILYAVKTASLSDILSISDTSDGLAQRIFSCHGNTLEALLTEIKAKHFALSRVRRVLMNLLIKNILPKNLAPTYLRVLALNDIGALYLRELKERCLLPIITKPAAYKTEDKIFELEKRATAVRSIISAGKLPDISISPRKL